MPEQLANEAELPEATAHVWKWFIELHEERTSNGMGENRINSTGVKDWMYVSGNTLEPWEVRAIRAIDREYMAAQSKT